MAKYRLLLVNPENASGFLGSPIFTDIRPELNDAYPVDGKQYCVVDVTEPVKDHQAGDLVEIHVRVKAS